MLEQLVFRRSGPGQAGADSYWRQPCGSLTSILENEEDVEAADVVVGKVQERGLGTQRFPQHVPEFPARYRRVPLSLTGKISLEAFYLLLIVS